MEYSPDPMTARNSNNGDENLTVLDAARRAGVTQSAIIRWIRNGYLSATPSEQGWLIPASMLAQAARTEEDARGTGPVPRKSRPSLEPTPTPIRKSFETRMAATSNEDIGEHIVTPLAELIRDQIDVVHDQAEVIGWLQAERKRLADELAQATAARATSTHQAQQLEPLNESELYDEVLSLLWKDADSPERDATSPDEWLSEPAETEAQQPHVEADSEAIDPFAEVELAIDAPAEVEQAVDAPDGTDLNADTETEPELKLEDYADPSWFFDSRSATGEQVQEQPRARLQPIVPRKSNTAVIAAESQDERVLHQMIDETERKIADLWTTQEKLRSTPRVVLEPPPSEADNRHSMWQRLWPLRR